CNDDCFRELQVKLTILGSKIQDQFKNDLRKQTRFDDSDALSLNFEMKNSAVFSSNFAFLFEDLPGMQSFEFRLVKTFDDDNYRYSVKRQILKNASMEYIEANYISIVSGAVEKFNNISLEEIMEGTKIKLFR